ncbi:site-specific recombinase XerD [Paraburkholderia sp. 40]
MLDCAYATGLRVSELIGATLGDIRTEEHGDHWLHLVGKGGRPGKVALPPLARTALAQYLVQRRLPVTPARAGIRNRRSSLTLSRTAPRALPEPACGT